MALVATDLDGTVIPAHGVIPPTLRPAVRAARQAGVLVIIATGRTYDAALPFLEALDGDAPLICCQGALVHDRAGRVLREIPMRREDALAALAAAGAAEVDVLAYWADRILIADDRPALDLSSPLLGLPPGDSIHSTDLRAAMEAQPPLKIQYIVRTDRDRVAVADALGPSLTRGGMLLANSGPLTLEATDATATKGHALEWVAASLGFAQDQVLALGDQANDVTMIAWAGMGLAVGNAVPEAIAVAKGRAPHVDEGPLAWALQTYGPVGRLA